MGRSLSGSRVLVLGGSSGIGLAAAKAAADAGAKVTIASRSGEKVNTRPTHVGKSATASGLETTADAAREAFFVKPAEWDRTVASVAPGKSAGLHAMTVAEAYRNTNAKV